MVFIKTLSKKKYWAAHYTGNANKYSKVKTFFSYSLQNHEYFQILKKFLKKTDKTILEIGCAPGSFLIKLNKKFGLEPHGVEYTQNGAELTKKNLTLNEVSYGEIVHSDVFDLQYQKKYQETYDLVISLGFIEHFDDLKKTLEAHSHLAKKRGTIIVTMPNLKYWNKHFVTQEVLDIHNLEVMDFSYVKKNIPKNTKLAYYTYYGGLFNFGSFFYKNRIAELLRTGLFLAQRLLLDPIGILLANLGLHFSWKKTSPMMVVVLKKK